MERIDSSQFLTILQGVTAMAKNFGRFIQLVRIHEHFEGVFNLLLSLVVVLLLFEEGRVEGGSSLPKKSLSDDKSPV